ncbi:hypothetical protein PVBG_05540 [Plasmodium vivax Brazil I]|uniref:Uncharacterized protein n=1 Tax=Plasmodium vivax (strain Brazil I) TaxID=1033975 RepID=A0A0J9T0N7_PLAV1|nr:hypothetical protein PVBG_05540 [Plasmodium vivax Brazil I]
MIKIHYTIDNKGTIPWCKNFDVYEKTSFPDWLTLHDCEEKKYQEQCSEVHIPKITTDCECPKNEVSLIPSETVKAPEADRTKNIAVTSGFTAAGTLGTLFFLYRFTPMMSWFRRPGMNNVGTDLYMNPGGAESFISMQQGNGSNNLFYQP